MFSKYSVKRPYTVLVGVVLVIVLGIVSLTKMTTDLLPNMSFPYAIIVTTDMGASPEEVERDVTSPIEASVATTSNIKSVSSQSNNSYSIVICEYEQTANMDSVMIEIQQKLDQLKGQWSDMVGSPMIMQIDPDMLPIMMAAVDVEGMDQFEISDYVNDTLIPQLESTEGVASVSASGTVTETIEVTLNEEKIKALNEKVQDEILGKFVDPEKQLNDGKAQVEDGQKQLADGQKELSGSFSGMLDGRDQLLQTEKDLKEKREPLVATEADLKKQKEELVATEELLTGVVTGLNTFVSSEEYKGLQKLDEGIAQLEAALPQLEQMAQAGMLPADQLEAQKKQLESLKLKRDAANKAISEQFKDLAAMDITVTSYSDIPAAAAVVSENLIKVRAGIVAIDEGLSQVQAGISAIDNGLEQVSAGKTQLSDGMAQAISGAMTISQTYATLADTAATLEEGKKTLNDAKENALSSADMTSIISVDTISGLLVAQNFDMPAGYASKEETSYLVRVGEKVTSIDDLKDVILMNMGMDSVSEIHLSDVADIEVVADSGDTYAVVNGTAAVMLSMEKQTGYSTGDVTDSLLEKFEKLQKADENLSITVLMNQGVYIDMIVQNVLQNMIIGAILAMLVLWIFMKDIKPTIVIACSIPLSVITAITLMYFTGVTLNVISMSGLALGIGMLVDNSIVVIENIYRFRAEGYSVKKAAVEGASQVSGAIIASTLTTVSVFAPIIFTDGITRQLFVDMGLTILFTLGASLFVALTFVPAMGSAILKRTKEIRHPWFEKFQDWYGNVLNVSLRFKPVVFILAIVLLATSMYASLSKGFTFMDMDMESNMMSIDISAHTGESMNFDQLVDATKEVTSRIENIEGIETIGSSVGGGGTMSLMGGGSGASMYVLVDDKHTGDTKKVAKEIAEAVEDITDYKVEVETSNMDMTALMGSGISVQVTGSDIQTIQKLAGQVADVVRETEGTVEVNDGMADMTPEFVITVDKEKAAEYGYTVAQVYQLVAKEMATNKSSTNLSTDLKTYEVFVQTETQSDTTIDDILNIEVPNNKKGTDTADSDKADNDNKDSDKTDGDNKDNDSNKADDKESDNAEDEDTIKLEKFCTFTERETLSTIRRSGQTRYINVSAKIDEDHNVTLVANDIKKAVEKIDVPDGYKISMKGEDESINDAMKQMLLMLLLAVIFIYLIMVAQFQSLSSPFIIMFTIPLAFTGGFFALFFAGIEVSVIAMLGFIMLAGLIVNNGIVLIDYINQARRAGESKHDAIIEAGKTRLRPILMTAMTTILAMSTMAAGIGSGSEMGQPMAITMIGGLVYGTILTLIVVPCIYDAFHREKDMTEEEL